MNPLLVLERLCWSVLPENGGVTHFTTSEDFASNKTAAGLFHREVRVS